MILRSRYFTLVTSVLVYAFTNAAYAQSIPTCIADTTLKMLVCALPQPGQAISSLSVIQSDDSFPLSIPVIADPVVNRSYTMAGLGGDAYTVYFTGKPVINISTPLQLNNRTKVKSQLTYVDGSRRLDANVGIEYRGATALSYPKKSYDLEFWTDTDNESQDVSLAGMRSDDDWVLDALYNEPLRINALVAQRLWNDLYELPYANDDDRARGGAGQEVVEVFFNGEYQGIYTLGEQVDRKLLRLKKTEADTVRGHLVKVWAIPKLASSDSIGPPSSSQEVWTGYELKYPNPNDSVVWAPFVELHDRFAPDAEPSGTPIFGKYLDLENTIDYDLYVNVIGGLDNAGKNIYFARRDSTSPYLFIPWDLDATLGNNWTGERLDSTEVYYTPLFHDVIQAEMGDSYETARCERYAELRRSELLSARHIGEEFEKAYNLLTDELLYDRENKVWPDVLSANQDELDYTYGWLQRRFDFLDTLFCPNGLSSTSTSTLRAFAEIRVSPNPVGSQLNISLPAPTVGAMKARVYDVEGKLILAREFPPQSAPAELSLGVSTLQPGIYLLSVDGLLTKFVKR